MRSIYRLSVRPNPDRFEAYKSGVCIYFDYMPDINVAMKAMCEHLKSTRIPSSEEDRLLNLEWEDMMLAKQALLDERFDYCREVLRVLKEGGVPGLDGHGRSNTKVLGDGGMTTMETVEVWTKK